MKQKVIATLIVSILIGVTMIGLRHTDKLNDQIKFKQIELQDNSAKLKLLDKKYLELNKELDTKDADKIKLQQELDKLQKERDELQKQLQAKLKAKEQDLASKAQNAVTAPVRTPVAYASGGCEDWIAQAGISDVASASELIRRESNCNPYAINSSSGSCGIAQELPCGKSGCQLGDGLCQIIWMKGYVEARYGSFGNAVAFHNKMNWY